LTAGDVADRPVQRVNLQPTGPRGTVIAGLHPLLLIAARAERLLPRAGQAHDADIAAHPGMLEAVDQLVERARAERVQALRAVDGDGGETVVDLVDDISQLIGLENVHAIVRPPLTDSVCPVT
jgi:hypothetical protein